MSHCFYKKNSTATLNEGKYIKHLTIHINEFDKNLLKNKGLEYTPLFFIKLR